MPNLRIISDNAADRGNTTVSSSVGSFGPGNLKNDLKSLVWRSAGSVANLIAFPKAFESWGGTVIAVTPNATMAPDGTMTADLLARAIGVSGNFTDIFSGSTVGGGNNVGKRYTFSIWLWVPSGTLSGVTISISDVNYNTYSLALPALTSVPTKYTFTTPVVGWYPLGSNISAGIVTPNNSNVYAWDGQLTQVPQASVSTTWNVAELIAAVALPFSNLTPTASMRVRLTNEKPKLNWLANSQEITSAYWGPNNAVSTADTILAPDETWTADTITCLAATALTGMGINFNRLAAQQFTLSIYAKLGATNPRYIQLLFDGATTSEYANFDLVAGTVTGGNYLAAAITLVPSSVGGWYRISFKCTMLVAGIGTAFITMVSTGTTGRNPGFAGDNTKAIHLWGAQLELGDLSSYYRTTTGADTRPAGYIDNWQSYAYDSTALACPAAQVIPNGFTALQAQSAYAYGGGAYAKAWFAPAMYTGCRVDVIDIGNQSGYIEASRLIIGNYWSPAKNASYGFSNSIQDMSKNVRTQSGDLMSDSSPTNRKIAFNIEELDATDRKTLYSILRRSGMRSSMFISLAPENVDIELERDNMIYGKLSAVSAMSIPFFGAYSFPIEMEEI